MERLELKELSFKVKIVDTLNGVVESFIFNASEKRQNRRCSASLSSSILAYTRLRVALPNIADLRDGLRS